MDSPNNVTSRLSPKQREILEALISGSTISDAAAKSGVHRSTVHLWCRQNTIFRAALRDAESQQSNMMLDGLRERAAKALQTVDEIMTDPCAPAAVRLRAATLIIQAVANADPYAKPAEPRLTTSDVDRIIEAGAAVGGEEAMLRQAMAAEPEGEPRPPSAGQQPVEPSPVARQCLVSVRERRQVQALLRQKRSRRLRSVSRGLNSTQFDRILHFK